MAVLLRLGTKLLRAGPGRVLLFGTNTAPPAATNQRITASGDTRITESGDTRTIEGA